jgi:hypothetical protein
MVNQCTIGWTSPLVINMLVTRRNSYDLCYLGGARGIIIIVGIICIIFSITNIFCKRI